MGATRQKAKDPKTCRLKMLLLKAEADIIVWAFEARRGNMQATANFLGISHSYLHNKVKALGLDYQKIRRDKK